MTEISKRFRAKLTEQSYGAKPTIDGVRFIEIKRFLDDQGEFSELGRLAAGALQGVDGFQVLQINHSLVQPGAIKAWHVHRKQEDLWFVPPDERLVVGLLDTRDGSRTEGATMRFILGDGVARLVYIPRGVAHGASNPFPRPARILYFVNQQFDAKNPDELRLPWDAAGAEFWSMTKG